MILWFQLVMHCWLWALLGLVLLGFPLKFCRGTSGQMMCETPNPCVPAQRWPSALPPGVGPGQRSHILGAQGFKHLSSSFLRCHNLGSTCGLRHSKWCLFKASWKQRAVEGVPAHSMGVWSSWSSTPNHSRILWYSSMKIKGIDRSLKVQIVLTSSFTWSNGRNVSKFHNYVHRDEFVCQVQADAVEIGQCCYL